MKKYRNMKQAILSLLIMLSLSTLLLAQDQKMVEGTVKGEDGEGLPGVTIVIDGTGKGTVTNIDGFFKLSVSEGDILSISFIGFESQQITIGNQTVFDINMEVSSEELEEVVVTAMGVSRSAKSLTYARQAVDTEDLTKARTSNFLQGLSGKAAGLQVTNSMSNTGSNRVVIRGNSSLLGNNTPIYVIDGVVMDQSAGDDQSGSWGGNDSYFPVDYGDPLSNINPDDIESMEVLKGGNATALYGSRASNGVILITTKRGSTEDGWGVSINSNTMFQSVMQWPDYQYAYGTGANGVISTNGANGFDDETGLPIAVAGGAYGGPLLGAYNVVAPNGDVVPYNADPRNVRDLFQTGVTLTNSIAIDRGSEDGSIRFGYTNTNGSWVMPGQDKISRHNFSLRATRKLNKKLNVDASLMYVNETVDNRVIENGGVQNPQHAVIFMAPDLGKADLVPWKTQEGYENIPRGPAGPFRNPYWNIFENDNNDKSDRVIGKWELTYEIIPGLKALARVGNDLRNSTGYTYFAPRGPNVPRGDQDGRYSNYDRKQANWNYDGMLLYNKTLANIGLEIDGTVGVRQNTRLNSGRQAVNDQLLPVPAVRSILNNAGISSANETDFESVLNSVYGYVNVGYKGFAYLNATITREWSSTLSKANNDYYYPSVGGTVIFSEFIPENRLLSFGKVRATYARTGSGAAPYRVNSFYNYVGNYAQVAPYTRVPGRLNNPNLRNEETEDFEVGLEARLFNNRVNANITYYTRDSYDQIVEGDIPAASGYSSLVGNAGLIRNEGWEIFMTADVLDFNLGNKPFRWNVAANWSTNNNRVIHLKTGEVDALGEDISYERFVLNNWNVATVQAIAGERYGTIVGIGNAEDSEGRPLIGENGQPIQLPNKIIGNNQADWTGGITNSFSWNGISMSFLLDIRMGGDILSQTHGRSTQYGANVTSLEGRDDFLMSDRILGENGLERQGVGIDGTVYNRGDRAQGPIFEGVQYSEFDPANNGNGVFVTSGKANDVYISPNTYGFLHWTLHERNVFDASYVKLRSVTIGYDLPSSLLSKTPFQTVNISVVGRNLWNIYQKTPHGIDPEANSTSGNGQGLEYASFLPSRSYGFNINLKF